MEEKTGRPIGPEEYFPLMRKKVAKHLNIHTQNRKQDKGR